MSADVRCMLQGNKQRCSCYTTVHHVCISQSSWKHTCRGICCCCCALDNNQRRMPCLTWQATSSLVVLLSTAGSPAPCCPFAPANRAGGDAASAAAASHAAATAAGCSCWARGAASERGGGNQQGRTCPEVGAQHSGRKRVVCRGFDCDATPSQAVCWHVSCTNPPTHNPLNPPHLLLLSGPPPGTAPQAQTAC